VTAEGRVETPYQVFGVQPATLAGDETDVGLRDSGKVEQAQASLAADVIEELLEAVAVPRIHTGGGILRAGRGRPRRRKWKTARTPKVRTGGLPPIAEQSLLEPQRLSPAAAGATRRTRAS